MKKHNTLPSPITSNVAGAQCENVWKSLDELLTPCFIFDEAEFERGVTGFRDALEKCFDRVAIGYSVKTNSLPYALRKARLSGCMAEVVSHDEYRLARLCGYEPARIIYNGPMKSEETFIEAVTGGAVVNIECKRELDWLDKLPTDGKFNVGLRLNINISDISPEDADGDNDNSRFGFSVASGEFADAVRAIRTKGNVRLAGLHIHRTAHSRSPRFYSRSIAYAAKVINDMKLSLDYLDVGGGYFGIFPNKPTFADYAKAFLNPLKGAGLEGLKIIVEPGNALTASSFAFLTSVLDTKTVDRNVRFVTTDGSRNDIDPFFHKSDYLKEIMFHGDVDRRPIIGEQFVTGCTCLEYDRLFTLREAPELIVGDRILYNNVGAYTMTLSPQFIRLWPRVYAFDGGEYREVRCASTAENLL